jgi:hypothetical protein
MRFHNHWPNANNVFYFFYLQGLAVFTDHCSAAATADEEVHAPLGTPAGPHTCHSAHKKCFKKTAQEKNVER